MTLAWRRSGVALLLAGALLGTGCAAGNAYRQGQKEARSGNWDLAVARLTLALQKSPGNIKFKIALENARIQAGRFHHKEARKHVAAEDLDRAAEELEIASRFDPSNESAATELRVVRDRIHKREEEREQRAQLESMKSRAQAARVPLPVLSPRSAVPITLHFTETSLEKVFETLSKVSGVNILFDEGFRDKRDTVNLTGVSFQEALELITFKNRLFYKVVDQNTLIIVPESPAKRRSYDELLVRTFYLENAEANDTLTLVKNITGITKSASNVPLNAITLMGTIDQLALAARVIEANDKARGEVMVEVEILEVNRTRLKQYGIELANYTAAVAFSPTGAAGEIAGGLTSIRAHLLSSFNLADFVVSIPSGLLTRFLQTDNTVRLLAAPRLRAAEGKKTSLRIGTEVPVPVTTFTSATTGGPSTFAPATSFQYRNVGVNLEMTPKVSATGEITLELAAEFSLPGGNRTVGDLTLPVFNTRNVTGLLRMREGQTTLIGGLVQGNDTDDLKGVLGLQSIPLLNKVFTSRTKTKEESEIIISLTPHLVRAPKLTEEDFASTFAGTLERVNVPSARPPLFGPEEPAPSPAPAPSASPGPDVPGRREAPTPPVPEAASEPSAPSGEAPTAPAAGVAPTPAPGGAAAGRGASVLLSPAEATLKSGETASLGVVVLGATGLLGVEVVLSFDAALIEALEAVPGPLMTLDGSPVNTERNIEPGRVRVRLTRGAATAGSGAVVTVKLKGLRAGSAIVVAQSITLVTDAGTVQPMQPGPARLVVLP